MASRRLSILAEKLLALRKEFPDLADLLEYAMGALYALMRTEDLHYAEPLGPFAAEYEQNVDQILRGMACGIVPDKGRWVAGHYFNSALARIAAVYERSIRALGGPNPRHSKIGELVEDLGLSQTVVCAQKAYLEQNFNKHDISGGRGRTPIHMSFDELIGALEETVTILEQKKFLLAANHPNRRA